MRLIIAEDEVLLRAGLTRLLTDEGYDVVATASSGPDLVTATRSLRPDLVIPDLQMPPTHTRAASRPPCCSGRAPDLAVLVLSSTSTAGGHRAPRPRRAGRRLPAQAADHRRRPVPPRPSARCCPAARSSTPRWSTGCSGGGRTDNPVDRLSPRRRETLALMAQGMSNARIAEELVVTEHAVARNISAIFDTLGLPPSTSEHRRVLAVLRYLDRPGL